MKFKKLRVATVLGTRPEIIRLSRVIPALDRYFDHILIHTGQNYDYELNQIFFDDLNIRHPDYFLDAATAGNSVAQTIGAIISKVDDIFEAKKPDALLVLGDTNSCLSVIPAKRRKIPIFHMEAGNRCFDDRVPEEINRRIIDHTADINLTYSQIARSYLIREGLDPATVINTGSPMREVLTYYTDKISKSDVLQRLNLINKSYFLVSCHREENVDSSAMFEKFCNLLNFLSDFRDQEVIVSTHPRTKSKIENSKFNFNHKIRFLKPLSFTDYNKLQICANCVLSDSGTITEEASILNFPALNIREAHERPEGMEEGAVMLVGLNIELVGNGLLVLENQNRGVTRTLNEVYDYKTDNVSEKVIRLILSYTDYINRNTWKRY